MRIKRAWNRRTFLRAAGLGGCAALLPFVPQIGRAQDARPLRLLLVQTGNGTILPRWRSNGAGSPFVSGEALPSLDGPILRVLDRHRRDLLLLDGLDIGSIYVEGRTFPTINSGHGAASCLWTGVAGGGATAGGQDDQFSSGPSVDQVIANHIGGDTPYRSLQLGVWRRPLDPRGIYSYDLDAVPLVAELDPRAVFDRIFAGVTPSDGGAAEAARRAERRRRSLDLVRGELGQLRRSLGSGDRLRFDRHIDAIGDLESRIMNLGAVASSCVVPERPRANSGDADRIASFNAQMEIIKTSFACDLTRVASFAMTPENVWGPQSFIEEWDRSTGESHNTSHATTDPDPRTAEIAINNVTALSRWHARKLGELIDMLKSVEDGPGETLFDNTVIVWGMAMSQGGYHTNRNPPFLVAHGKNGPFNTGRYLRWGEYEQPLTGGCGSRDGRCHRGAGNLSNNHLLVSLCQGFGVDVDTFGDTRFTGPLPNLV
ncbi:MAG: DUF1552 domain-containing protein [Myxococcota bacterium]